MVVASIVSTIFSFFQGTGVCCICGICIWLITYRYDFEKKKYWLSFEKQPILGDALGRMYMAVCLHDSSELLGRGRHNIFFAEYSLCIRKMQSSVCAEF